MPFYLLPLVLLLPLTQPCGPGRSWKFSNKDWLKPGEHLPQRTSEVSMFGSGNNELGNCSEKVQILSTDIVFKDPTYNSESRLTTKVFELFKF